MNKDVLSVDCDVVKKGRVLKMMNEVALYLLLIRDTGRRTTAAREVQRPDVIEVDELM